MPPDPTSTRTRVIALTLFIGGVLIFGVGLMFLRLSERSLVIWRNHDRYVRTEMEVLQLNTIAEPSVLFGRVLATGDEIYTEDYDISLLRPLGPGGIVATTIRPEDAMGRRYPIWYDARARRWAMSDLRIVNGSEFEKLPGPTNVLIVLTINIVILVVGLIMTRSGWRRLRKLVEMSPPTPE